MEFWDALITFIAMVLLAVAISALVTVSAALLIELEVPQGLWRFFHPRKYYWKFRLRGRTLRIAEASAHLNIFKDGKLVDAITFQQLESDPHLRDVVRATWGLPATDWMGYHNMPALRAWQLLLDNISSKQQAQLIEKSEFTVWGPATKRTYRITMGSVGNVYVGKGRNQIRYCFMPAGCDNVGDVMLAQKIMLENEELAAMAVANDMTNGYGGGVYG